MLSGTVGVGPRDCYGDKNFGPKSNFAEFLIGSILLISFGSIWLSFRRLDCTDFWPGSTGRLSLASVGLAPNTSRRSQNDLTKSVIAAWIPRQTVRKYVCVLLPLCRASFFFQYLQPKEMDSNSVREPSDTEFEGMNDLQSVFSWAGVKGEISFSLYAKRDPLSRLFAATKI